MRSDSARFLVWLLAVASCLAGIFLTRELSMEYLEVKGYTPPVPSAANDGEEGWFDALCNATESASCEQVAQSPYASWPFGSKPNEPHLPVALLGMFYFTAVLAWLGLVGRCSPSRWWAHLIFMTGTAVGVGTSVFFEYIMWTKLDHYCPLCVIAHVLSLLLLVFAVLLWPRREATVPKARAVREGVACSTGDWPTCRILLATPIVALVAIWGEFLWVAPSAAQQRFPASAPAAPPRVATSNPVDEKALMATLTTQPADALAKQIVELRTKLDASDSAQDRYKKQLAHYEKWEHALTAWEIAPRVSIAKEGRPFRGPANARHTLVVYSDFECPGCKDFEKFVNERVLPLSARYGGSLRVMFKYWPICKECNANVVVDRHPAACKAALAAEAARIVGGDEAFWKMYDLLWKKQADWKKTQDFRSLAREVGLNEQAFEQAMGGEQAQAQVKADIDEGAGLGKNLTNVKPEELEFIKVNSTPAIFVDDKRLWLPFRTSYLWLKLMGVSIRPMSGSASRPSPAAPGPAAGEGPVANQER